VLHARRTSYSCSATKGRDGASDSSLTAGCGEVLDSGFVVRSDADESLELVLRLLVFALNLGDLWWTSAGDEAGETYSWAS
jgi:hypothetical protein